MRFFLTLLVMLLFLPTAFANVRIESIGNETVTYNSSGKIIYIGNRRVQYCIIDPERIESIGNETVIYNSKGKIIYIGNRRVQYY